MNTPEWKSTITGRLLDRSSRLSMNIPTGRYSRQSACSSSMDLTYRDYFGPPNYTPFDEKMIELDFLHHRTKDHIKKLNGLKLKYMDWFTRKCHSFLESIKLTQVLAPKMLPVEIKTMQDYKKIMDMSRRFPRNGTPRDLGPAKMDEFYFFWLEMVALKEDTDDLYESLCKYCESVTRLRQPSIKLEIDRLKQLLDEYHSEEFDFSDVKNERDNLFVYKLAPVDYSYHGIMGFIPFLVTSSVRMLSWFRKVYLEKE